MTIKQLLIHKLVKEPSLNGTAHEIFILIAYAQKATLKTYACAVVDRGTGGLDPPSEK